MTYKAFIEKNSRSLTMKKAKNSSRQLRRDLKVR